MRIFPTFPDIQKDENFLKLYRYLYFHEDILSVRLFYKEEAEKKTAYLVSTALDFNLQF